jgi:hypothetical protein
VKFIPVLVVVVALGVLLWLLPPAGNDAERDDDAVDLTPFPSELREDGAPGGVTAVSALEPGESHDVRDAGTAPAAEGGSAPSDQPDDWPDHVESLIYDYLAKHSNDIASINVVHCDKTTCNVSFYARDASEASRARLARIPTEFTRDPINAGSIGYAVRVPSPGLLEVQITLYGRSVRFVQ